jgi:hypothetical protein
MRALYLAFISFAVIRFDAAIAVRESKRRQRRVGMTMATKAPTPAPAATPGPGPGSGPADLTVGVFYYPWHTNNFHNGDGFLREQLNVRNGISVFV